MSIKLNYSDITKNTCSRR